MQVEQIDRDAAINAVDAIVEDGFVVGCCVMSAVDGHEFASYIAEPFARHRHQARAEVVGEIVAWLREEAVIYRSAWAESVDPRASAVADHIEAKFGGRDAG